MCHAGGLFLWFKMNLRKIRQIAMENLLKSQLLNAKLLLLEEGETGRGLICEMDLCFHISVFGAGVFGDGVDES